MKEKWNRYREILHYMGVTQAVKSFVKFIIDQIIVLSTAVLFMRFSMMCGLTQTISIIVGMVIAIAASAYLKFRYKLL